MRNLRFLLLALLALIILPNDAVSQVSSTAGECPTVYVTGPAGITAPGELYWFEATVKGRETEAFEFDWLVSIGKIVKREGKSKIGVLVSENKAAFSLTATVRVRGLPEGCPNDASETGGICDCSPLYILLDEFSIAASRIKESALGSAVLEVEKNRADQLYIIEYFPVKTSRAVVDRKLTELRNHLSRKLKFDLKRVTIVTAVAEGNDPLTKIYSVPPGAENPQP